MIDKEEIIRVIQMGKSERKAAGYPSNDRDVAFHFGIHPNTILNYKAELRRQSQAAVQEEEDWEKFMTHLYAGIMVPGAPASKMELYTKLKGRLVEKHEVKVGQLTADEITKRNIEADRQLRDAGYRVEEVCEEPYLLPENVL